MTVTDADRRAAAEYVEWLRNGMLPAVGDGTAIDGITDMFARHREQARREALEEAQNVVFNTGIARASGCDELWLAEQICAAIRALIEFA